jgi:glutamyl-tRNA synthetase
MADELLAPLVTAQLAKRGIAADARLSAICALFKDRCDTTVVLADWAAVFYADVQVKVEDLTQHVTEAVKPAVQTLSEKLNTCAWDKAAIADAIKEVLTAHSLKMPQLAMPVRVLLMGTSQTPSLDAIIALFSREEVLRRLQTA